jgi:hypothetical protein
MPLIHGRPLPTFCQGGRVEFRRYVASSISSKNIPRYYQAYKLIRDSDLAVDNVQNGRTDSNGQTWPTTFERFQFSVNRLPCGLPLAVYQPHDHLTAHHVQHGVEPNLIYQPSPSPGIKTHSSPAAFPTSLSLPFPPSFFSFLHRPSRSCLRPHRAPPTSLRPSFHLTEPI